MALRFDTFAHVDDSDDELAHLDDPARNVRVSDKRLVAMALRAAQLVDWNLLADCNASRDDDSAALTTKLSSDWVAHKHKAARPRATGSNSIDSTRIFTRDSRQGDSHAQTQTRSFAVLAHATIPCSLQELQLVLETATSEHFCDLMRTIVRDDFRSGELVHATATETRVNTRAPPELLVKAVAFETSGFFSGGSSEEWCYLDFAQHVQPPHHDNRDSNDASERNTTTKALRKTFAALDPEECFVGTLAVGRATQGRDVVAGLLLEEDADGRATRVALHAEHFFERASRPTGPRQQRPRLKKSASKAAVRARLLRVASSIERLGAISRRRRLGVQVLVDDVHVKPTNASCPCCQRSFLFARKKLCSLCGYFVCERCSAIEDRERCDARRMRIEHVRICHKCIVCVDHGNYDDVVLESLAPARVVADAPDAAPLRLGTALVSALQSNIHTETPKAAVLNVINALADRTGHKSERGRSPDTLAIELRDARSETAHLDALRLQLDAEPAPELDACVVSNAETRSYRNEHPLDPNGDVRYVLPPPAAEAKHLDVVRTNGFAEMVDVPGLDLICAMAHKQLACLGAMVTVVEEDYYHVVATSMALPTRRFPRHEGFCSRTILDDKPLFVPHLQADMRFSYMQAVAAQNLGFYCGFPLLAQDMTVIGSLCCAGPRTKTLTRSEFVLAKRLAAAASAILQTAARRAV